MAQDKMQGEGNYDAAREYDEKASAHAKNPAKVHKAAKAAEAALNSPEAEELAAAEKAGKAKARD